MAEGYFVVTEPSNLRRSQQSHELVIPDRSSMQRSLILNKLRSALIRLMGVKAYRTFLDTISFARLAAFAVRAHRRLGEPTMKEPRVY